MIDYYQILGVSPAASAAEIRQAYRKLAHIYHPDKNQGDKRSLAQFNLIKEAYETLTHPKLKTRYLQERWLFKANGSVPEHALHTPEQLLQLLLEAGRHVSQMDVYRLHKEGLYNAFDHMLSEKNIRMLNDVGDMDINIQVVRVSLKNLEVLGPKHQLYLLERLSLIQITENENAGLNIYRNRLLARMQWEQFQLMFIIIVVMLLCILIWFAT